jgi:hypothetical protein
MIVLKKRKICRKTKNTHELTFLVLNLNNLEIGLKLLKMPLKDGNHSFGYILKQLQIYEQDNTIFNFVLLGCSCNLEKGTKLLEIVKDASQCDS